MDERKGRPVRRELLDEDGRKVELDDVRLVTAAVAGAS
jgi:hypothetical protein